MKALFFADLHLDTQFQWMGSEQAARRRRQGLRQTLLNIRQLANDHRVDVVLCAGDLYEHARFSLDTAGFVRDVFAGLSPIPVIIAPGNHDWYGPQSLYHQVTWSSNVRVFTNAKLFPMPLADGLTLWGAAHRAPANTDGFLDAFVVDRGGVNIALFHGSEQGWLAQQEGGKPPHAAFREVQIEQAGLHHAFVGHYHRPRYAERYTYPGNPEPLAFGEDGERGAVLVNIRPDGKVDQLPLRVGVTTVHDLRVDVTGCRSQQDVRDRLVHQIHGLAGVARVTLYGELSDAVDLRIIDLQSISTQLDGLVIQKGRVYPAYDFDVLKGEATVRGEFVREVLQAAELTDEDRTRVLVAGLRALDGRNDLEIL